MTAYLVFIGLMALVVLLWVLPRRIDITKWFRR